jgi:hypothetical protein
MSALPPKAVIGRAQKHVRHGRHERTHAAQQKAFLLNHLVGPAA